MTINEDYLEETLEKLEKNKSYTNEELIIYLLSKPHTIFISKKHPNLDLQISFSLKLLDTQKGYIHFGNDKINPNYTFLPSEYEIFIFE